MRESDHVHSLAAGFCPQTQMRSRPLLHLRSNKPTTSDTAITAQLRSPQPHTCSFEKEGRRASIPENPQEL